MAPAATTRCVSSLKPTVQRLAIAALISTAVSSSATADGQAPRVRSYDPAIIAAVREGTIRSATFKQLVDTIDATDGLVYIEHGKCGHSVRACLLMSVKIAGPNRVLRIVVNLSNTKSDCDLIASIGHELRHAVEALSNPTVRSNPAIHLFFDREGPTNDGRFETKAAVAAGLAVDAQCGHSEKLFRSPASSATAR